MNLTQRFFRFGIGLFIGTVLAYLFFQGRSCSDWLPERRIRASLEAGGLAWGDQARCVWDCIAARESLPDPVTAFVYSGDVDWGRSGPRESPKRYVFRYDQGPVQQVTFLLTEERSTLQSITLAPDAAPCSCPAGPPP
ncbi:MAG: hypothetical protein RJA19_521 [Bacteroidota bacterium]|jgi:hypothetical protein